MSWLSHLPDFHELTYRLGWVLLHSTWQGALAAVLLFLLLRITVGSSSATRYAISLTMIFLVLASSLITGLMVQPEPRLATAQTTPASMALPAAPQPQSIGIAANPRAARLSDLPQSQWDEHRVLRVIVLIWGIGVTGLSLWQLGGWMILRHYRRTSTIANSDLQNQLTRLGRLMNMRRKVTIAMTSRLETPIVIGIVRPIILVPISMLSELSANQIEAILAHELAHIRRHDYLINLIQCAIETLLFYHPAIWWISRQIRAEREYCCDELAARVCGNATEYGRALLALEELRSGSRLAPAVLGSGAKGDLLRRVRRLLGRNSTDRSTRSRSWALAFVLVATCLAMPLLGRKSVAQTTKPTEPPTTNRGIDSIPHSPITPEDLATPPKKDYLIGTNDALQVSIAGLVQADSLTTYNKRVSETGTISLPLIGEIAVVGLTEAQIERDIARVFRDRQLIQDARVSVTVLEARGQSFSIIGDGISTGQYAIRDPNFRLLDAIVLGRGNAAGTTILLVRKTKDPQSPRIIEISGDRLISGNPDVNIVVQPGDTVIVRKFPQPVAPAPATQPRAAAQTPSAEQLQSIYARFEQQLTQARIASIEAAAKYGPDHPAVIKAHQIEEQIRSAMQETLERTKRLTGNGATNATLTPVRIVVDASGVSIDGRISDWASIRERLTQLPEVERKQRFIELLAGAKNLPVKDYFAAQAEAQKLVSELGLAYLSSAGIVQDAADVQVTGDYFMGGEISRSGVYSTTGRKISVKAALISAGIPALSGDYEVEIVRHTQSGREILRYPFDRIMSDVEAEITVMPNDEITLLKSKKPATQPAPAN